MVARFMASIGCLLGDYRSAFDVIQSSREVRAAWACLKA